MNAENTGVKHLVPQHDQDLAAQDEALQGAAPGRAAAGRVNLAAVPLGRAGAAAHHWEAVVAVARQHIQHIVGPLYLPEAPASMHKLFGECCVSRLSRLWKYV